MFTKGVVACALSSMLISTTVPSSPLEGEAQAQQPLVNASERNSSSRRSAGKGTSARRFSQKATQPRSYQRPRPDANKTRQDAPVGLRKNGQTMTDHLGTFSVSAYTHYRNRRGGFNETATGSFPKAGRTVAVDPRVIPLGSRIYIAGIGERIAEDTGGKIKGKKLDLFLPSVQDCIQFGVQRYEVHLLAKE